MEFSALVEQRRSVKNYDSSATISDDQLKSLFAAVVKSPSSFNLQHWGFVVSRDQTLKESLQGAAWGQPQVAACSAVVVVCGKLDAYQDVAQIFAGAPDEVIQKVDGVCQQIYGNNEQAQRDEAIRGSTLAAMSLMYAAKDQGLDSGPMIGFDPNAVAEILDIPSNYIPTMMIVLGTGADEELPPQSRKPLDEVVKLEKFSGNGLS
ncbi:MAG: nitroreductase family protein [Immundisolibacteraceae bacterium]|nr:nitroreductase family protein [Immundisolibacteraceae bacterium]